MKSYWMMVLFRLNELYDKDGSAHLLGFLSQNLKQDVFYNHFYSDIL